MAAARVKFDFGLVSFLAVGFTHVVAIRSTALHDQLVTDASKDIVIARAKLYMRLVLWLHLVVAINYIVGIVYYTSIAVKAYCATFCVVWLVSGLFLRKMSLRWFLAVSEEEFEEEIEENKSMFQKFKGLFY